MKSLARKSALKLNIIIGFFLLANGLAIAQDSLFYRIEAVAGMDRTNLEIDVRFRMDEEDSIKVGLIAGNYGTPNLYKYVIQFVGKNETIVRPTDAADERLIFPNQQGEVNIHYVISIDPSAVEGAAFAPIISQDYFDIAGCQWLLHIGDDTKEYVYSIELNAPEDWYVHSSLGEHPNQITVKASFNDLIESRIGGGGEVHKFDIQNKPVSVIIKGDFDIPDDQLFSAVEQIVTLQRKWFNDYDQPFFHVVINARNGVVAGTAIPNEFVCFVGNSVSATRFNEIVAHEMFHYWLPGKIDIDTSDGDIGAKHEWFTEGFTTYFARKILLDAGLITTGEFAEFFNTDILKIKDNPYQNISYLEMEREVRAGDFYSDLKNLAYQRGALIAFNWDLRLTSDQSGLNDYMRALYNVAMNHDGLLSEDQFLDFSNDYGIEAKRDFKKYIINGESIKFEDNIADLLGDGYEFVESSVLSFDPGFDLIATKKNMVMTGVKEGENAYEAGLRNGMEYVRMKDFYRYNGWSKSRPMKVKALVNGIEKEFEFVPYGKPVLINQIVATND